MGLKPDPDGLRGWTPTEVEWINGEASVDWCYTEGLSFTDPFFRDTIERSFRFPARLLFRHRTTLAHLEAIARAYPGLPPAGFIFHGSRCGSTLVTQMLAQSPSTLVLSEPGPLQSVLGAQHHQPGVTQSEQIDWLRWIVAALGQPATTAQRHLVIKLDAWSVIDLALLRRAFPEAPWVFVYRDPVEVLASHLGHRGYHMVPGTLSAEELGLTTGTDLTLPPEEHCALVLERLYMCAHEAAVRDGGLLINYHELPDAVISRILPHFGLTLSSDDARHLKEAAQHNAKNPAIPFEPDAVDKQRRASQALRAASRRVDPAYDALERHRRSGGTPDRVRLPLTFDLPGLQSDVGSLPDEAWQAHFNRAIYEEEWSGVALRAPGGAADQIYPDPATAPEDVDDTEWLSRSPHLQAALRQFECPITSARLLALGPGARILEHDDYKLGREDGQVRLHIPIISNPAVEFYLADQPVAMAPGDCWYLNLNLVHRAVNPTAERRVHLVIDCIADAWLDELLRRGAAAPVSA